MKKLHLNIVFFLSFLALFSLLNLAQSNRPTVSELENRNLKAMPVFSVQSLAEGGYLKDLEAFFADTFIFRDSWVRLANEIAGLKGFTDDSGAVLLAYNNNMAEAMLVPEPEPINEEEALAIAESQSQSDLLSNPTVPPAATPGSVSMQIPAVTPSPTSTLEVAPEATPEPSKSPEKAAPKPEDMEPKKVGGLLIANGRAMETHYFADSYCKLYAETLNAFQNKLKEGTKVYSLVAPVAIEFYNVEKYRDITSPQDKTIATINSYFNGGITPVDAYTPISQHTDEYIYFRSDHHWTATGAYYAYTGFMKALGEEPVPLSDYETDKVEGFLGSLYQSTLSKTLGSNPDTITLYKPYIPHTYHIYYEGPIKMNLIDMNRVKDQNKYRVFMSGDRPWSVITTNVKNGKKIVVIKDSYGNAFIPFLLPHFEEIYTVDPRQFKLNILTLMEEKGIDTVLFLNYVNATGQKNYLDLITEMTVR